LITFQGGHNYISPSWYEAPNVSPETTIRSNVPTWNYQAVHVYGQSRVFECTEKLKWLVDSLSSKYESSFDSPWQAPYDENMLRAIVGVGISITEIQAKYKLSQNKPKEDQVSVARQLNNSGASRLAQEVARYGDFNLD